MPAEPIAFSNALVGRWLTCSGSVFGDSAGLEFAVGGLFYKIYPGSTPGTVVRAHGFGEEGTWSLSAEGTRIQLNMNISGQGSPALAPPPIFTVQPRKMQLNNFGSHIGDYAID